MKKLVIVGAGPHSKVIIDIIEGMNEYEIIGLTDLVKQGSVLGYPILGNDNILNDLKIQGIEFAFIAVGNNIIRKKLTQYVLKLGFKLVNAISIHSKLSEYLSLGKGIAVMPGAIINADSIIGDGVIINTNASIDHDCKVGSFVHIAPGSAVSGSTIIEEGAFLGTGTKVIDNVHIGKNTIIGAGGVVVKNIPSNCIAVGLPAKVVKNLKYCGGNYGKNINSHSCF